jgi:hypothetical protein
VWFGCKVSQSANASGIESNSFYRRFCPLPEIVALNSLPFCRGVPFADNAKQLLVPLLGMPSPSVTAALLLMSYYELGMNSEAGVWNYCGLAMRMAIDLGLHRKIAGRFSSKSNRMLFWW